ncbi:SIS domain-containing protein [Fundicoccus ignavus]|uniref:SIS domain-containing protein n=1 Tax=Fundicoccus ignavus TaxID=2664442 RepID=A0A844CJE1_9LACT|nr:SIS domain-containing protein [Fundicoccus ignavus]MRJ47845.1 SIS domain-containing protein [Fundicoccus ignavus]
MFEFTEERLSELGASITTREIKQQPRLWQETLENYLKKENEINDYLSGILEKHSNVKVIFTGAGTSAYVGESIEAYLNQITLDSHFTFHTYATTDIVSNPMVYLKADTPTLLVSFARSGNSPESIAAVELSKKIVKDFYQLTITCAADGQLALAAQGDDKNLVLLQPDLSNDQGFAMTGSFTCMSLTALLTFDSVDRLLKENYVSAIVEMGKSVIEREGVIQSIVNLDYNRVVYLGSGGFKGLAQEAQLKILELTAGKITTVFDSSLGFRHGPKSFINDKTLVFVFLSNDAYTRKYDEDIVIEMSQDQIAAKVLPIQIGEFSTANIDSFGFDEIYRTLPDAYLIFPYILFGQTLALLSSIKVGNKPDTPSPSGTVNRVVKGVTIYPL